MIEPLKVPLPLPQDFHKNIILQRSKRAYLVMGVPSSGTRLMGRLLLAAGCIGDTPELRPFDHHDFWEGERPTAETIVIRRHIPLERQPFWGKDQNIIQSLWQEDYDVYGLVMSRCQLMIEQSALAVPFTDSPTAARGQVGFCWQNIMQGIPRNCPFEIVQYESLVKYPELYLKLLGERIGLVFPDSIEDMVDGNHKHWEALRAS